jgi:hypothetical protein
MSRVAIFQSSRRAKPHAKFMKSLKEIENEVREIKDKELVTSDYLLCLIIYFEGLNYGIWKNR